MYRAKVESVSGINVRAGGKWLTCIGNKTVRVGDYVWTDGRCVYGNNRVSQQPLVITAAPDDEVIPIIWLEHDKVDAISKGVKKFYTFSKGQLKLIEEIKIEPKYIDPRDYMMINDSKKQILFSEETFYDINQNTYSYLLATNINRQGDKFDMVMIGDKESEEYEEIQIRKNGDTVRVIDAMAIVQNFYAACPSMSVKLPYLIAEFGDCFFYNPFIEDENNWRIQFQGYFSRGYSDEYTGPYPESGLDPATWGYDLAEGHGILRYSFISPSGTKILYNAIYEQKVNSDSSEVPVVTNTDLNDVKFLLQDGYYYKLRQSDYEGYYFLDFFSPKGTQIFSNGVFSNNLLTYMTYITLGTGFYINLIHTKGSYLLSLTPDLNVNSGSSWLCVIKGESVNMLYNRGYCLNQRLRAMKNAKNWTKFIQELTF